MQKQRDEDSTSPVTSSLLFICNCWCCCRYLLANFINSLINYSCETSVKVKRILVYLAVNESRALFYRGGHQLLSLLKIHQREPVTYSQKRALKNNNWIGKKSLHRYCSKQPVILCKIWNMSQHLNRKPLKLMLPFNSSVASSRKVQPGFLQ